MKGLNPHIRKIMVGFDHLKFGMEVNKAIRLELEAEDSRVIRDKKRTPGGTQLKPNGGSSTNGKRFRYDNRGFVANIITGTGERSNNQNPTSPRACFICGSTDHMMRECPQRDNRGHQGSYQNGNIMSGRNPNQFRPSQQQQHPISGARQKPMHSSGMPHPNQGNRGQTQTNGGQASRFNPGRAYAFTQHTTPPQNPSVMEGIILLFSTWVKALFDSGASHSFISSSLAFCLGLDVENFSPPIFVGLPVGGGVILNKICRSCVVVAGDFILEYDLILMDMDGFEVILGMDWLSCFDAIIECH